MNTYEPKPAPPLLRIRCIDGTAASTTVHYVAEDGTETIVDAVIERITIEIDPDEVVKAHVTFNNVELDVVAKEAS